MQIVTIRQKNESSSVYLFVLRAECGPDTGRHLRASFSRPVNEKLGVNDHCCFAFEGLERCAR